MSRTIRKRKASKQWDRRYYVEDWINDGSVFAEWWRQMLMDRFNVRTIEQAADRARAEYHRRGWRRRWVSPFVKKTVQHEFRQASRAHIHRVMRGNDEALEPVPVPFGKWYWD